MRLNPSLKLRTVAGETIVVRQGASHVDLTRIISLNASSERLWRELAEREFSLEDVADVLCRVYGIDRERALHDGEAWIGELKTAGCLAD